MLEKIVKHFSKANIVYYDYNKIAKEIAGFNIPTWRGSSIANGRLFFSYFLPSFDHLLYLDSDTIVHSSLNSLKTYNNTICMVKDEMPKNHWQNLDSSLQQYCNS